jgi:glutamine amidotransferase
MSRLFGFRSPVASDGHLTLTEAVRVLHHRNENDPDGWGVAYYLDGAPHVVKNAREAFDDLILRRVSGIVTASTVVGHVRQATSGDCSVLNTHPFQFGSWVFAHVGSIDRLDELRPELLALVAPRYRHYVLGETDSELYFYVFLSELTLLAQPSRDVNVELTSEAMANAIRKITQLSDARAGCAPAELTAIVTNGPTMVAVRWGSSIFVSNRKLRCSLRDSCPAFQAKCENDAPGVDSSFFVVSSEPVAGENVWSEVPAASAVGVDWRMRVFSSKLTPR